MRKRGVPKGYKHKWNYPNGKWNEIKVGPGTWKFTYTSAKTRGGKKARFHPGSPAPGSKVTWKIDAIQTAKKVSANTYLTRMKGTKRLIKMKHKKWKR